MAKPSKSLSPRITYSFLGLLGVAALLLGFFSLGRTIYNPAERSALERQRIVDEVQSFNIAAEQELRVQDTDNDGLTDFNELNLYGTSPYLADSDSDGFGDKQEIESGNDPNCPTGVNCRSVPVQTEQAVINEEGVVVDGFQDLLAEPPVPVQPEIDLTKLTAPEIRQLMLQSGEITEEQLSEIDDETIMEIYQEVINESQGNL